jgi:asparagine synthase (glutamine-hydrolysing)
MMRRASKAFRYAGLEGDDRIASYFNWIPPDRLQSILGKDMKRRFGENYPSRVADSLSALPDDVHALNRMLYLEGKYFLADHNLNYVDKVSMANGVEVRVPMLDPDLVDLAARLPIEYKQRGGVGKWVLRRAMEPYLPKEVISRGKTGFGAPLRQWLRSDLRPMVEEVLSKQSLERRGLFDPDGVKQLIADDQNRKVDATYTIFSMICIELWCRMFVDKDVPALD